MCLSYTSFLSLYIHPPSFFFFFFFNDTATTEIYTLSLHDALPIYREPPVAVGRERQLRGRVEATGIHPLADRDRRDQRAGGDVGARHDFVAATAEQQMVRPVDGQPRGRLARRERPLAFHPQGGCVDLRYGTLVLQVHEELPVPRGNAELRTRPQIDAADSASRHGIDHTGGKSISVEGEDPLCRRVVQNGIVVRGHHGVTEHSERLEVEHRDGAVRPRRSEAVARFILQGDPVRTIQPGNLTEHFPAVG